MRRARMIPWMIEQSFNFRRFGAAALDRLASVVSEADCVELTMNNLDEACATVLTLLEAKDHDDGVSGALDARRR